MNILTIDTETTSENRFCYDLGWSIFNTETKETIKRQFLISEVWENEMLFSVAYYFDKKDYYIKKSIEKIKWAEAMFLLLIDIRKYNLKSFYGYNVKFDLDVFEKNCQWFKTENYIKMLNAFDIWAYATNFIVNEDYIKWCIENGFFTESENISANAENIYRFITKNVNFEEKHNSICDIEIELEILLECVKNGAEFDTEYKNKRIIKSPINKELEIFIDGKKVNSFNYIGKTIKNNKIYLKS